MTTMSVQLRSIPDTQAAMGWAEGHTIVVDRPDGKAGGMGLGFNGGQLLGLAIGGCFCNDLQYVAHDMGVRLAVIEVDVMAPLGILIGIALAVSYCPVTETRRSMSGG